MVIEKDYIATFPAKIVRQNSSLRVTIPNEQCQYYGYKEGDTVLVRVVKKDVEETEEKEKEDLVDGGNNSKGI